MGKLAIFVLGVAIGSTWLTGRQAASATICAESATSSERAPARSEPRDQDDYLGKIRVLGGELWHRFVQPALASAATHTLDALTQLVRNIADNASSGARSQASLDRNAPVASTPARESKP